MQKIKIRVCKLSDVKLLLNIHNSSVKGGYFGSKNIVKYKDHIEWLKKKLKANDSKIYIGILNEKKFGYVRFDKTTNKNYEVSIANISNFYGKGLGSQMLNLALRKFIKFKKPKKIFCFVKKFNIRSQKCFLKNGFKLSKFNRKKNLTINKINLKKEKYFELSHNIFK